MSYKSSLILLLSVTLSACATTTAHGPDASPTAGAPVIASAAPAHDQLLAVLWTQTAIEYQVATRGAYRQAAEVLQRALADPNWQALPVEEAKPGTMQRPPAVIVDVDETVLDNSPFQARLIRDAASYSDTLWEQWIEERVALPTPGADDFARLAAQRGVTVFYVSNRKLHLTEATRENLRLYGFPLVEGTETILSRDYPVPGCATAVNARLKGCRRKFVAQDYRVVMLIGDNLGDFLDNYNGTRAQREKAAAPYAQWWGERWIMLPNPMYGSWDEAITKFENDPAKVDVRAARRAALRTQ